MLYSFLCITKWFTYILIYMFSFIYVLFSLTNLDSILKSNDITLLTKVHIVQAMVFPVVMYGRESWTIKKAEYPRIDAFSLWCWRSLLRVSWIAKRSNHSALKEINTAYSLEGLILKLRLQYFEWRANSLGKTLMLGKIEGKRRKGWRRMTWLDGIIDSMDMSLSKLQEIVKDREAWRVTVHGVTKSQTRFCDWTAKGPTRKLFFWRAVLSPYWQICWD